MIITVEQRGTVELCCYPRNSWAVFVYKDGDESNAPGWKCVINGKLETVLTEYRKRIKTFP